MSESNNYQVGGTHYESSYQHWDWARDMNLEPMLYQVSKYVIRARLKNGVQDIDKAIHFAHKAKENAQSTMNIRRGKTKVFIENGRFKAKEGSVVQTIVELSLLRLDWFDVLITELQILRDQIEKEQQDFTPTAPSTKEESA